MVLDAPIPAGTYPDRKQLAAALQARLAANAASLRQGRLVDPLSTPPPPDVISAQ
jgi:hypothetical protein